MAWNAVSSIAGSIWWRSEVSFSFFFCLAACRTRLSACDTLTRFRARRVLCWSAFLLVPVLGSTGSAADCSALFVGFLATTTGSDFSGPFINGFDSSSSHCGPAVVAGQPRDLPVPVRKASAHARVFDHAGPGGGLAVSSSSVLPSALTNASAPSVILFTRLNGWPVHAPADASPASSRRPTHGSGSMRFATPSSWRTCTAYFSPVYPAHRQSGSAPG